ncbi:serine protease [Tautonia sp. JC769]|uniref:NfeD family protein n=1 Tax=Tautonia sp. JC769 TaxID=3232135 RepID=UPI003457EA93
MRVLSPDRSRSSRMTLPIALVAGVLGVASAAIGQAVDREQTPGHFFQVEQPIDTARADRLRSAVETVVRSATARGAEPILVFEIRPGTSDYGICIQVADFIAQKLSRAEKTVAYVPEPLSGYALFVALACDEIVLGPSASLGPITPAGEEVNQGLIGFAETLARTKGRPPDLIVGMLDPSNELLRVRTADGRTDYVLRSRLPQFETENAVLSTEPVWQAGARGKLAAEAARSEGIVRSFAADRGQLARIYDLDRITDSTALGADTLRPVWIQVARPIDGIQESFISRQIARAEKSGANLIVFQLDTPGGQIQPADELAQRILRLETVKTVAYVRDRALGVGSLLALACDEIVFHDDGKLGKIDATVTGGGKVEPLGDRDREVLADRLAALADQKGYPTAVARALVRPDVEVVEAIDTQTAAVTLVDREAIQADPDRYIEQGTLVLGDELLTVTAANAQKFDLARTVLASDEEFSALYGLGDDLVRLRGPSWVDSLVGVLNTPFMSGLLLFVGFFMLVVEMKLPGIGLPAITACLAFLLFFWSRYLGGTADGLEIILFMVGLLCLALELFVFPGFGVFGMSGVFLILFSVVMASHSFIIPTEDFQYRQLSRTLILLMVSIAAVVVGAVLLGRFFPSLPLFDKLILKSDPFSFSGTDVEKDVFEPESPFAFLLGETGRTTTVLRPSGRARFGEIIAEVTAERNFIEQDSLIQVVDVQGSRIIVKQLS